MDYLAEALKSPAAEAFYKSLSACGRITFDHNSSGTEWSSATVNGAITIIHTWIRVSQDFPSAGKFVGEPFTIEEAQAWLAAHPAQ